VQTSTNAKISTRCDPGFDPDLWINPYYPHPDALQDLSQNVVDSLPSWYLISPSIVKNLPLCCLANDRQTE